MLLIRHIITLLSYFLCNTLHFLYLITQSTATITQNVITYYILIYTFQVQKCVGLHSSQLLSPVHQVIGINLASNYFSLASNQGY